MDTAAELSRPRPRRSHSALPKYHGSSSAAKGGSATPTSPATDFKKSHKVRHSLHHAIPGYHSRHLHAGHGGAGLGDLFPTQSEAHLKGLGQEGVNGEGRDGTEGKENTAQEAVIKRTPLRKEEIILEKKKSEARNRELRSTLENITDFSMNTTRQLDSVYYAVLEKVANLRSTVDGLQELSTLTRELREGFQNDVNSLQNKVKGSVNNFKDFKAQKERISGLETRITASKERSGKLVKRVEGARDRIRALEVQEEEYQTKISKRLAIFWSVLGFFGVIVLSFLLLSRLHPHHVMPHLHSTSSNASRSAKPRFDPSSIYEMLQISDRPTLARGYFRGQTAKPTTTVTATAAEDARMRLLEEL